MIREKLQIIYKSIGKAQLIGVTKTRTAEEANKFIELSKEKIIGENYIQEYVAKKNLLIPHTSHFIGKLQSNKVKKAVELFDVIQTVESEKLALAVDKSAGQINKKQKIMLQVNISNDPKKAGCSKHEVLDLVDKILKLKNIEIVGLMTIILDINDQDLILKFYMEMAELKDKIYKLFNIRISLSMGMSDDYQLAVKAGSDFVRIGTYIFGDRT